MQFANHASNIIFTILLARILSPSDFGLVAMILVISEFSRVLLNFGFGQALIQKLEVKQVDYSSVFWLNILIAFILSATLYLSADLISTFYKEPRLIEMTKVLSFSYIIAAFGIVPQIILTKEFNFKALAKIRVSAAVIAGLGGIIIAYNGGNVWALVFIELFRTFLVSFLSWFIGNDWRPSFIFKLDSIKSIYGFSLNLFGNETLNYWMDNLDKILIGRMIGDFSLGLYRQSYSFMMLPVNNIARVANSVLFPSLSEIQDNTASIRNALEKSIRLISLIVFPMMLVLFIVSESFVNIVLGEAWKEMAIILRLFSIVGIFYTLSELTTSFYMSIGKTNALFRANLIVRMLLLFTVIIGIQWGLIGLVIGLVITSPVKFFVMLYFLSREIGLTITNVTMVVFKHVFIFIAIGIIGFYLHDVYLHDYESLSRFFISSFVLVFILMIVVSIFLRRDVSEVKMFLTKVVR